MSFFRRFLFDALDIRGAIVRLDDDWQRMIAGRDYPDAVVALLGEMSAITALLGGQLKDGGRLTFQLRGNGPVSLLVIDCESAEDGLRLRGMARNDPLAVAAHAAHVANAAHVAHTATAAQAARATGDPVHGLLGDGRLVMTMDLPESRQPFQSIVPLEGTSIGEIFARFIVQSEQQAARLVLAADRQAAAGIFVQKLPAADARDADGWERIGHLLATVAPDELCRLEPEALLGRLFHEETLRVFAPRPVRHHCPEDWNKVRATLAALGRDEIEALLDDQGEIVIRDDICNREYRVDRELAKSLLDAASHRLH